MTRARTATPRSRGVAASARRAGGAFTPRDQRLLDECRERSLALLAANLSADGMLACTPTPRAAARAYTAVFARDAAICALGLATCGDAALERRAHVGLDTLARRQAPNGQLPKFVDPARDEADFWYLGCIDATLWWLHWIDYVDAVRGTSALRRRHARRIEAALRWLLAQEHQHFGLLQQNEASDWADIMPRSGFVLYTNALWCDVKRRYSLPHLDLTLRSFHGLFHPFRGGIAEYRRAKLLGDYARAGSRDRELYLSFVNFSFFGEEGDTLGNSLAIAFGLLPPRAAARVLDALERNRVSGRFPARAVCRPIRRRHLLWRPYMARHRQNYAWQYHNGGIWPMVGAFWILALVEAGRLAAARRELVKLARSCAVRDWSFPEWLHGRTCAPRGMRGQSWSAAGYLLAAHAVETRVNPLGRAALTGSRGRGRSPRTRAAR